MSDYMTPAQFIAKIEWEGGIPEALGYGLSATDLDPHDEDSTLLRAAWLRLEDAAKSRYVPAVEQVERAIALIERE